MLYYQKINIYNVVRRHLFFEIFFMAYHFFAPNAGFVGCSPRKNFSARARTTAPGYFSSLMVFNRDLKLFIYFVPTPWFAHSTLFISP